MLNTFHNELQVVKICLVSEPSLQSNTELRSAKDTVKMITEELLDIHLRDHIIVSGETGKYYSFCDSQMLSYRDI